MVVRFRRTKTADSPVGTAGLQNANNFHARAWQFRALLQFSWQLQQPLDQGSQGGWGERRHSSAAASGVPWDCFPRGPWRGDEQLAPAQTGAPRGAASLPLGETKKRCQPWFSMMQLSSFLNAGENLFKPCVGFFFGCFFFSFSWLVLTCQPHNCNPTTGAVAWPPAESSPLRWAHSAQPVTRRGLAPRLVIFHFSLLRESFCLSFVCMWRAERQRVGTRWSALPFWKMKWCLKTKRSLWLVISVRHSFLCLPTACQYFSQNREYSPWTKRIQIIHPIKYFKLNYESYGMIKNKTSPQLY